jgi:hypothetical protein
LQFKAKESMKQRFKYKDEQDKSYGICGMAISLVVWDEEDLLVSVSMDSEPKESIILQEESLSSGNQHFSAKLAWNQSVKELTVTTAMILANVMCRNYMQAHTGISRDAMNDIKKFVRDEGHAQCSLERDECDNIFEKCYSYFDRIFAHQGVQAVVSDFASSLIANRTMSANEVIEKLQRLSRL